MPSAHGMLNKLGIIIGTTFEIFVPFLASVKSVLYICNSFKTYCDTPPLDGPPLIIEILISYRFYSFPIWL